MRVIHLMLLSFGLFGLFVYIRNLHLNIQAFTELIIAYMSVMILLGKGNFFNSGRYKIDNVSGVPFVNIQWDDGTTARYLMLVSDDFLVLYSGNSYPAFFGFHYTQEFADLDRMFSNPDVHFVFSVDWTGRSWSSIARMDNITATSSLVHGGIHFAASAERLNLNINSVWAVEGGVDERLHVTIPCGVNTIYISTGYVNFTRPYLFEHNSRPRRIRISFYTERMVLNERNVLLGWENDLIELELADTPNFQRVDFSPYRHSMVDSNVVIEILEIFPGIRYNHTVINSIMGYHREGP